MLTPVRRVVTGHDPDGRSIILADGAADAIIEHADWPGRGAVLLWHTDKTPPDNQSLAATPMSLIPAARGTTFAISQIPPESQIASMDVARRARLAIPTARLTPGLIERDVSRHPGMHATDTLDYIVILAGELTMLLDGGEVVLRPHDVVVQRGTNHAWVNRGTKPVILACVVIGAEPMAK